MSQPAVPISLPRSQGDPAAPRAAAVSEQAVAGRLLWNAPLFVMLGAFAVLVAAAFRYRVDVPYLCQWWFVYDLQHLTEGNLQLGHLWWQHNEHRIMFPKMILLPLARLTNWNTAYEVGLNLACAGATFLFMARAAGRLVPWRRQLAARWFLAAAALGFFSLAPWEAWLWGWTLQIFLNVAAVMGGILLLSAPRITPVRLAGAIACGIVASYSFANGLIYWFAVLPLLALGGEPRVSSGRRVAWTVRLAVWGLLAGTTIVLFFYGYQFREQRPLPWTLESAVAVTRYLAAFLGAPLRPRNFLQSQAFGAAGLLLLAGGSLLLVRRLGRASLRRLAPVWTIALYPILSAAIAVPGRIQGGEGALNISRHLYIAAPFWVAVYAILFAVIALPCRENVIPANASAPGLLPSRTSAAAAVVAACFVAIHAWGSVRTLPDYRAFRAQVTASRTDLLDLRDDGTLWRLHNKPERMIDLAGWLRQQRLSIYR